MLPESRGPWWSSGWRQRAGSGGVWARVAGLGREFAWVSAGQASAVVGSIVGLRVLTGAMLPAEYGVLALALTVSTLLSLTVFAAPGPATLRYYGAALEQGTLPALLAASRRAVLRRGVATAALGSVAAAALYSQGLRVWAVAVLGVVIQAVFGGLTAVLDAAQNAARRRSLVAVHAGLAQWLRFLIAIALFQVLGATGAIAVWGYALASVVVFMSQSAFARLGAPPASPALRGSPDVEAWERRLESYGRPYTFWGLPYWIHSASERWALERFVNTEAVGLYSAVAQLGFGLMTIVYSAVVQFIGPVLFRRAGDGGDRDRLHGVRRDTTRLLGAFLALTLLGGALALATHGPMFRMLVSAEFQHVSYLWPVSVVAGGLFGCGQLLALAVASGSSNMPLMVPKIGSAALGTVITAVCAYYWGVGGVVWASLVSAVVYLAWTYAAVRTVVGQPLPRPDALGNQPSES